MKAVHAIFVHGVGEQDGSYADAARRNLQGALRARGSELYSSTVLWAPVLDVHQRKMSAAVAKRGSSNRPSQRLVMGTLADALSYRHHADQISALMDDAYMRLRADEVVIFAHSLGGLLTVDWLRSRTRARVAQFHTFGCNLELFYQGAEDKFDCPAQLRPSAKWTNYFDEDDMLGWPLRGWLPQVDDIEVSVGGLLSGWWGLSHTAYWDDSALWCRTIPAALGY